MDSTLASLFLSHSVSKLEQMTGYIEICLSHLTQEQVWHREHAPENAIGNLVLHLIGNVRQWIGHSVGGHADTRNRPAEFAAGQEYPPEQLARAIREAVDDAIRILDSLTEERLAAQAQTQDGERSGLEIVYQVVGHFQQHTGQILFATKRLTGTDLGFYKG